MSAGSQNLKIGRSDPGIVENELQIVKLKKMNALPMGPPKMSLIAQNLKIGRNAPKTVENECMSAKYENYIQ
jgi:hypothetical protein